MISLVFFGTESFAKSILESIIARSDAFIVQAIVTQPPRPVGRQQTLTSSPVHLVATEHHIPVLTPESLSDKEVRETLHAYAADIFLVAQYGQIIPKNILDLPRLGAVNVHASLLPLYRGASPVQAALLSGDTQTGVSFMQMDEKMDHGPVFAQYSVSILPDDTTLTLMTRLAECATAHLTDDLIAFAAGEKIAKTQNHTNATFVKLLTKKTGYINWCTMDAAHIERMTRALNPWPGVTISAGGQNLRLLRTHSRDVATTHEPSVAGTIHIVPNADPTIATISGELIIDVIQPAGKKPMSGKEFAHGYTQLNAQVCVLPE